MKGAGQKIVKNIRSLLIGQVATWCITLVWVISLPRYLGDVDMGRYAIALAVWAIMSGFINTGTATYLTKEISKSPERAAELIGTALIQRYIIFALCCILVALYAYLMQYSSDVVILLVLVALSMPALHTTVTFNAVFQGLEVMEHISRMDVFMKGMMLVISLALMLMNLGIKEIAAASVVVGIATAVIQWIILRRYIPIRMTWNTTVSHDMLQQSMPYFVSSLALTAYSEIDKLIMPILVNERAVGWYTVAVTFSGTLIFIPNILATAIFPALSRGAAEEGDSAALILRRSLDLSLITGIPIGLGLAVVASPLVDLMYGSKFPQSGPVLSVLSIALIFTYISTVLGRFLVAYNRTNFWTIALIIGIVLAFPLNFLLIPWTDAAFGNGAIGCALRLAITEMLMAIFALAMVPRGILTRENLSTAVRTTIAGLVMMLAAYACLPVKGFFVAVPVLVGVVTYVVMILVLRVLSPQDLSMIQDAIRMTIARRP